MSDILTEFVARARGLPFGAACDLLDVPQPGASKTRRGQSASRFEYQGACPRCGGEDRFSVNRGKGVWNCRGCGQGGADGIGLAAHINFLDLHNGADFLKACSLVLGEPVPEGGAEESPEQKAAREQRIAEAEARAADQRVQDEKNRHAFRDIEIRKARGLFLDGLDCLNATPEASRGRDVVCAYLSARTGFVVPDGLFEHVRFRSSAGYYRGEDDGGRPLCIYLGPVMILPIVGPDAKIIGCHQTWIDLGSAAGKYRPVLYALTKDGAKARRSVLEDGGRRTPPSADDIEAGLYERLPTKKMRGSKKGGVIPLLGAPNLSRWVGGEGIENVIAFAGAEGFRVDTFYFTSGDLGNLAGPRDPASDFYHPDLIKPDVNGHHRRVKVQGPLPKPDQAPDDAMPVAAHVRELALIADGDSEPVMTASAMARAEARLQRPGLDIVTVWPPAGTDFSSALSAAADKGEA